MSDWMMVLVDFGCMVFIAKTALEHVYFVPDMQPQVEALLSKAETYEARSAEEIELRSDARSRFAELRSVVKESERELEDVRRQLNSAYKVQEQLENAAHQTQFQQGVRNGRRVHHAVAAAD